MADNVTLNANAGTFTAAADDIGGGVLVQRVKVTFGSDGTANDVSGANPIPTSLPAVASATITSLQTSATGANYATFSVLACTRLQVVNDTGTDIEFRRNGTGSAMPIADGAYYLIIGITDASQIGFRRKDLSNTQVTVKAEAFS